MAERADERGAGRLRLPDAFEDRIADGQDISDEERALMARALEENAVGVAEMTPIYDDPSGDK